jgi:hypothetical protein
MKNKRYKGMTLIELGMSMLIMLIAVLAVGNVMSRSAHDWKDVYDRVFGPIPQDLYTARETFETACRKAFGRRLYLNTDQDHIEVYHFSDPLNPGVFPDRYQSFYLVDGELRTETGTLTSGTFSHDQVLNQKTIVSNVKSVQFGCRGLAVQMHLTLALDGREMSVVWAGIRHN